MTSHPEIPSPLLALLEADPLPQGSFLWHRDAWQREFHDLPEVLEVLNQLPERVDRDSTRRIVLAELEFNRVLAAFICVMVWGYGTTGVGPLRTRWVLTGIKNRNASQEPVLPSVATHLAAGVQAVRSQGALEGFRLMCNEGKIKHLGSAYFTKWLYFTSTLNGPDDAEAAPILDQQVAGWLNLHADVSINVNRTHSYEQYLELLTFWGSQKDRSRVQVEKAIFGLATGRG